jgi:hypothetical protein
VSIYSLINCKLEIIYFLFLFMCNVHTSAKLAVDY